MMIEARVIETAAGYFAQFVGEPAARGPFRSRDHAERMLANATARKVARAAETKGRRTVPKPEPIEQRVIVDAAKGTLPRHERRARIAKKRGELQVAKRRAKTQARKAQLAKGGR